MASLDNVSSKLSFPDEIEQWFIQSKSVSILFTGRTGVGKSTLINSLVGKVVAKEGDDLKPETLEVTSYTTKVNGVDVTVWDTPGLQDASGNEDKYIADMQAKCKQCDLVVYCVSMMDTRISTDEHKAIRILTETFGERIWTNAVFVLSRANLVIKISSKKDGPNLLRKKIELFKAAILDLLTKCGIRQEMAEEVPIVPAGHPDTDELGGGPVLPPITKDWLSDFWFISLKRMKKSGQPAMLKANIHRMKKQEDITEEDRQKPASEQPIAYSEEKDIRFAMRTGAAVGTIFGTILGCILGGPAGAVAGAAIGGAYGTAQGVNTMEKMLHDMHA